MIDVSEFSTEDLEKIQKQCRNTLEELQPQENQLDMRDRVQLNNARFILPSVDLELTVRKLRGGIKP